MSISGTSYEPKRNKEDRGYRRYDECPSCHYRRYNNGLDIQIVEQAALEALGQGGQFFFLCYKAVYIF